MRLYAQSVKQIEFYSLPGKIILHCGIKRIIIYFLDESIKNH